MRKPKTKQQAIEFLQLIASKKRTKVAQEIGVTVRTLRYWIKASREIIGEDNLKHIPKEADKPILSGNIKPFSHDSDTLGPGRYVFTCAQNNTIAHKGFLKSLENFCEHRGASLYISKFSYNKKGFQSLDKDSADLWYDPALAKYFFDCRVNIADDLVWCGELDILPTATNPESGFDTYTKSASAIIPHSKLRLKSLPRLKGFKPKFIYTTGAVTQRNYIQRKAGQKAEFHHSFSALYVDVKEDGIWFVRQLNATDTGSFYDLWDHFTPKGVTTGHRVEAINWGDIHAEKLDGFISKGCWYGENSMLYVLRPKFQFIHDLTDFESRNHHNIRDPHFLANQHFNRSNSVEHNLTTSAKFIESIQTDFCQTVIVESNHDLAYRRWLREAEVKYDPGNARFFYESNAELYRNIEKGNYGFHIYEWALKNAADIDDVVFLKQDDSFIICPQYGGIECSMHGHLGPNGSRGSPNNLKNIGVRCNTGHTHSAGIVDGVYTAGVSASMDMGYNKGPSSWSFSHIITYKNGKRSIVTMNGDDWH